MTVDIRAISWPSHHANLQVLRFEAPLRDHAIEPAKFDYAWKMLQYCFAFPSPDTAVASSAPLAAPERALVERFVSKAVSLAGSPFLAHDTEMTVFINDEVDGTGEQVEAAFPHEESGRGFLTLLRQFAHQNEEASFKRVHDIAFKAARLSDLNVELLQGWGKYHKKLLARTPEAWAYRKALSDDPIEQIPLQDGPRVDQLFSAYFYGDVIHFGEGRDELAVLEQDAFTSAWNRMTLYAGASALAMLYMGYATILRRIYPQPD